MKLTAQDLLAQIRQKHASSTPTATDPGEKGPVSIPEDPARKQEPSEEGKTNPKNPDNVAADTVNPGKGPDASQLGDAPPATGKGETVEHPETPSSAKLATAKDLIARLRGLDKEAAAPKPEAPKQEAGAPVPEQAPKQASPASDYSADVLAKMASIALSNEDSAVEFVGLVERALGAEETQRLVKEAVETALVHTQAEEQALYEAEEQYKQAAAIEEQVQLAQAIDEAFRKEASAEELRKYEAISRLQQKAVELYGDNPELFKAAMAGIEDAGQMADGVDPETGEAMEGEEAGTLPGGGEDALPDDDILALIEEALASGAIDEEKAAPLVEALLAGQEEGSAEGDPAMDEAEAALA